MALMGMETASSSFPSSSSIVRWKYDVFLSFRGNDTRYNFMDHLWNALKEKGINTFRDDENLERGKLISPELLKAIEESRFAIVILSKNYASSTWCLDELAKIIACKKDMGMIVLPIFHYVDPSNLRQQMGTFLDPFVEYEKKENKERVEKWRDALRQVSNLAGWHLKNTRSEIKDIKDIVGRILLHLKYDAFPYITKDLVGIYSRMEELDSCLTIGSNNVRFIGMWGMGGIGKTTLARVVYYMISKKFEACSFIEDIREKYEKDGLLSLQQKIISDILMETDLKIRDQYDGVLKIKNRFPHKMILLVLDDVDAPNQIKMLAEQHDWFGPGSRIIITTRNVHLLKTHGVDRIYEVKGLNDEDALQLFCSKAFKKRHALNDYLELSKHFLNYAGGLPLALEVLGSFLFGKSTIEWKIALDRLKEFPDEGILKVLKISLNGLQKSEMEIFLHIACFFNHMKKNHVVEKLDILGLYPGIGLKELVDRSLLKITIGDIVWMHDLLEEMGRNIICQEYPNDPGKRSRLWRDEDIDKVLRKNKGTTAVQAMHFQGTYNEEQEARWNPKAFLKMYNLKFLKICGIRQVPTHLPNDLRILDWISYPSKSLPSSFQLNELVQLSLQQSKIEQLWIGRKNFEKLKFIDLSYSSDLTIIPDFTGVPNLEKLILEGCRNLCKLHPSIGILKNLFLLNLRGCNRLKCLPSKIEMESLVTLDLYDCFQLKKIPKNLGNVEALEKLNLTKTAIKELPSSIERLTSLTFLTLKGCNNLVCLPSTICTLKSLETLDLSECSKFENLPKNLGNVKGLKKLDLSETAIKELPSSIESLTSLTILTLKGCENIVSLPSTICSLNLLKSLDLSRCLKLDNLPKNLGNVKGLKRLDLSITAIKELPSSIEGLTRLTSLTLSDCTNLVQLPNTICSLKLLSSLDLHGCLKFDNLPKNIGNMKSLEVLNLRWTALKEVPSSIVLLKNLKKLHIYGWKSSTCPLFSLPTSLIPMGLILPSLSDLQSLTDLRLCDCDLLSIPSDIGCLSSLKRLNISGNHFVSLPESMSRLSNLRRLDLEGCKRLQSLENIPSTIFSVIANDCTSLERLPKLRFYPFRSDYSHLNFQCLNCFKLVDYFQSGSNMLQGLVDIIIPGGEIPKWFSHECQRDNIQVSFDGCDELKGIVLCVVFEPHVSHNYQSYRQLSCIFHVNGFQIAHFVQSYYFMTKYGKVESPHLWLLYLTPHHFISNWGKICSRIDANGFSQLEIEISASVDVEKTGILLVYKQDIEDFNQTMAVPYGDLGVIHHDIDNSTIESSRNKLICDKDDGAGPSGEGYSNEEPQPKWNQTVREFMVDFEDLYQRELLTSLPNLYKSATEGSRNKRNHNEDDGTGPRGESYSNNEPYPKKWRKYG